MEPQNDHEWLLLLNEKIDTLIGEFTNHLAHHRKYLFWTVTTLVGLIIVLATT